MKIYVFAGPTIDANAVRAELDDVEVCGPARFGDVYRAARTRPAAIAVIDGYFERVPAVWHKEILWAMAEGVHVFGASSMGALRAAELAEFGMVGVGFIYEAFRRGDLEDDDEVAVVHGPAEEGYRMLSEAMVNIRATVEVAKAEGVLSPDVSVALLRAAKTRFYADRTYRAIMTEMGSMAADEMANFGAWLATRRVDQKRLDALALVRHLASWRASKPQQKRVNYRFEATDAWEEATRTVSVSAPRESLESLRDDSPLEEELKLSGAYRHAMVGALARGTAVDVAARAGVLPDDAGVGAASEQLRRELGLARRDDFERWWRDQGLEREELAPFFHDHARVLWAAPMMDEIARRYLVDHLRANNDYARVAGRSDAKAAKLRQLGTPQPSLSDVTMTEPELWSWYFAEVLRIPAPDDLETFATSAGFRRGRDGLRTAVLRELQWRRHGGQ